ncbi:MAG: hypothetical protein H6Q37_1378 [Chloroflexi bacterium]|nr:hypothetical protein [Chloroflexota bacterium]
MKQDRFLLILLAAVTVLVGVAIILFFLRRGGQNYGAEDSPAGIVRNYVLAIQKGDYERAYAYLADDQNRLNYESFQNDLLGLRQELGNISVQIGETEQTGQKALVALTVIHSASSPFADVWRDNTSAILTQDAQGVWKIARMPYPIWGPGWYPVKAPNP